MKTRTITTFAAIAAACFAGSSAYAGTRTVVSKQGPPIAVEESCITGDLGVDVVSEYIRKGIVQENQGFIIQPYADLHFRIYKGDGALTSVTADIGIWNSFQDHRPFTNLVHGAPGAPSSTPNWFEFDFTAGLTLNIDKFSIAPQFRVYESPSDVYGNIYTVGLNLAYDDKDLWGDFALHPHAFVELQLIHTQGNGFRDNGASANGQYYEVGIAPAWSTGDLTLTLPINVGFGSGNFYLGNRAFGFASIGIDAAYALNFVPKCLGAWSVHAGAAYYRLGGDNDRDHRTGASGLALATINLADPDSGRVSRNQFVFSGGMKVAF